MPSSPPSSDERELSLTRIVCLLALDMHVTPASLLAMPAHLLDATIDEWQSQLNKIARDRKRAEQQRRR